MRTFNFIGDTTYTTREGISYRIDNKEHNIQRVGKSWVVDGKASSLEEMVKMGIAKKILHEFTTIPLLIKLRGRWSNISTTSRFY